MSDHINEQVLFKSRKLISLLRPTAPSATTTAPCAVGHNKLSVSPTVPCAAGKSVDSGTPGWENDSECNAEQLKGPKKKKFRFTRKMKSPIMPVANESSDASESDCEVHEAALRKRVLTYEFGKHKFQVKF